MVTTMDNTFAPDYLVTPGEMIEEELEYRHISKIDFAKRMGISSKHLNDIYKGSAPITPETAIKLERVLGMPISYWLNLEANYQSDLARINAEQQLVEDLDWLKNQPCSDLAKSGFITSSQRTVETLKEIFQFYRIAGKNEFDTFFQNKYAVQYKQDSIKNISIFASVAWIRAGELKAEEIYTEPYNKKKFEDALNELRNINTETNPDIFVPKLEKLCASAGVAVVFVEGFKNTGIRGVTHWISPDKAVLQLSLRFKSHDHLWFAFFHEAAHILLHSKKGIFVENGDTKDLKLEDEADFFASNILIPQQKWNLFIEKGNNFSKSVIVEFANSVSIHPGIVLARLQREKIVPYPNILNTQLKVMYTYS